jgi:hypothetical protein
MRSSLILLSLFLIVTSVGSVSASQSPEQIDEFGDLQCEDEMARLDNYAIEFDRRPQSVAYVIGYGGRRGAARNELSVRLSRIRRYLVNFRGLDNKRVVTMAGGFREGLTIELWLAPEGAAVPKATPTIPAREARFRKGRYIVDCSLFY